MTDPSAGQPPAAGRADRLHLSSRHREILETLLLEHLPGIEVWAYGSRVNGESHDGSDLDLVLRAPDLQEVPIGPLADFTEALHDSTLPFLVEARDWARLPERFHKEIERGYVVVIEKENQSADSEWRDMPFSEAVQINPRVRLERGKTYPYVDMASVNANYRSVSAPTRRKYSGGGSRFQYGDTLMARITPCLENGKIARFVPRTLGSNTPAYGSTEFIIIRGRPNATLTDFVYYLTRWDGVRSYAIDQMTGTSGRQRVPTGCFDHLLVPVPPIPEQHAIAHILGTLDDKIELNRRINGTLEAMVQALFKSWFVDFDPVRAKMEGRWRPGESLLGLPAHLYDLFPDRLVESELGEAPEGWEKQSIYNFANVIYGAPFASKQFNSEKRGIPLIRIRDLAAHEPGVSTEQVHKKGYLIKPGDIVVGMDGEFRLHVWKGPESWLNQRLCHFQPKLGVPTAFLAETLREPLAFFERGKVGTTVIHLGKSDIDTFQILQPGPDILSAFASIAEPLLDRTVANSVENRALGQICDLLLPNLMSGKIRLREAEKAVESVA